MTKAPDYEQQVPEDERGWWCKLVCDADPTGVRVPGLEVSWKTSPARCQTPPSSAGVAKRLANCLC